MNAVIAFSPVRRELARREGDGLAVRLLWDSDEDTVSVEVLDERTEALLVFGVPRDRALDAYNHPFAYCGPVPAASADGELLEAV